MDSSDVMSCGLVLARLGSRLMLAALLLLYGTGCRKPDMPPPSVSLEQLPAALEKAFARSKPQVTEKLNPLLNELRDKDYSKALMSLENLSALSGLNKAQAQVIAAGLITLHNALQEAQSQGDQNAAQTLQSYRATK